MDLAFNHMKALMLHDCLIAYSNHNKPFHIYTDAAGYQMGAYIVQDDNQWPFGCINLMTPNVNTLLVIKNSFLLSWF